MSQENVNLDKYRKPFTNIFVANSKPFMQGHYLFIKSGQGDDPVIVSDPIFIKAGKVLRNNNYLTWRISKQDSEPLYNRITKFESDVLRLLKSLDLVTVSKLPQICQNQLMQPPVDPNWSCLRPNYTNDSNGNPAMFLKGDRNKMVIHDSDSVPITDAILVDGTYQFTIRADMIYLGEHKNPGQIANLQLRVSKALFTPATPQTPTRLPKPNICPPAPTKKTRTKRKVEVASKPNKQQHKSDDEEELSFLFN